MNRVVLGGRLADRPRRAYLLCGLAIARLRLQVARQVLGEGGVERVDEIDCFAGRDLAGRLTVWGEPGLWVNLEGRLLTGILYAENGELLRGSHVWVDRAYLLDPCRDRKVVRAASPPDDPDPESRGTEAT